MQNMYELGQEYDGLFVSDNNHNLKRLADDINIRTDMILKGHVLT